MIYLHTIKDDIVYCLTETDLPTNFLKAKAILTFILNSWKEVSKAHAGRKADQMKDDGSEIFKLLSLKLIQDNRGTTRLDHSNIHTIGLEKHNHNVKKYLDDS